MRGSRLSSPQTRGTSEPVELGQPRGVAGDDVKRLAVGRQDHGVRAVLAAAVELAQELDLVELVVAVGVAYAIEPALVYLAAVDDDVQAVERPQQALGLADWHVDRLDLDLDACGADRCGQRDAVQLAVLVRDDQPALGVDGHVDPRALRLLGTE